MAIVVLFTLFFIVINLVVDVAYALIDPTDSRPHGGRNERP